MVKIFKSVIKSASRGVKNDPEIRKIINRFPKTFLFIKKRLTSNEKFGLDLTVGTFFTLFFIYLFFGIIQDYIGQDPLIQSDLRIINVVQIFRTPLFSNIMLFITYLGNWQVVFLGLFFICIILFLRRRRYHLWTFIISVGGGELFVWIIKNLVERPRPPLVNALSPEKSFSFPSGHGFVALSFYGLLSYYLFRLSKNKFQKFLSIFFGVIIILSIGLSRIYLGVHWPTDVLASFAVGSAWLTTLITIIEIKKKFNPHIHHPPLLKKKYVLSLSIFFSILWVSFIIFYFKTHPIKTQPKISNQKTVIFEKDIAESVFKDHSRYSEAITGSAMEPINIIAIGTEKDLDRAFKASGWFKADPSNLSAYAKFANAMIFKKAYFEAPSTPSFWNTIPFDISFSKPTQNSSFSFKYHIHFWSTPFITEKQIPIWVGTVHFDKELKKSKLLWPVHTIDPAVDKQRDFLKADLEKNNQINHFSEFQIVEPTLGKNLMDPFFTDGKAFIIEMKHATK